MKQITSLPGLPHMKAKLIRPDRCEKCKFRGDNQGGPEQYECRQGPPTATSIMVPGRNGQPQFITHTTFPIVKGDNWCGKWAARVEGAN